MALIAEQVAGQGRFVQLAIVLPTYNEAANIAEVIERLSSVLHGIDWEAVFVDDDSPDGTATIVAHFAKRNPRIRLLHRIGRRGLSSACVEGILSTTAACVAVMDADLQHDERLLPVMLARMQEDHLDLVIGTRNQPGGSMGDFSVARVRLSQAGATLSRLISRHDVSDPMSGFFMVDRAFFVSACRSMQGGGFKILLDLLASAPAPARLAEVPYHFRQRRAGESKLDINTAAEYLMLVVNKLSRGLLPARFLLFAMVGCTGVVTHLLCLTLLLRLAHTSFATAQCAATLLAMVANFLLNNLLTFHDMRLRGRSLALGLLSFCLVCSLGAFANLLTARWLYSTGWPAYTSGLAGMAISSVWNYSMSTLFTWRPMRPKESGSIRMAHLPVHSEGSKI